MRWTFVCGQCGKAIGIEGYDPTRSPGQLALAAWEAVRQGWFVQISEQEGIHRVRCPEHDPRRPGPRHVP